MTENIRAVGDTSLVQQAQRFRPAVIRARFLFTIGEKSWAGDNLGSEKVLEYMPWLDTEPKKDQFWNLEAEAKKRSRELKDGPLLPRS